MVTTSVSSSPNDDCNAVVAGVPTAINIWHDETSPTIDTTSSTTTTSKESASVEKPTSSTRNADQPTSKYWILDRSNKGGWRWIVLLWSWIGCILIGMSYVTSLFIIPVGDEFGVGRSLASFASTLSFFFFSLGCTFSGRLAEYYGVSPVLIFGLVLCAIGNLITSFISNIVLFLIFFGALAGTGYAFSYMACLAIQADWFPDRSGLAFGFTLSGVGVGNLIFAVVVQAFLDNGGWRYACQLMALIVAAGWLLCVPFVQRRGLSIRETHRRATRAASLALSQKQLPTFPVTPTHSNGTPTPVIPPAVDVEGAVNTTESAPPVPTREPIFQFALLKERAMARFMWASLFVCPPYYAPFFSLVPYADDMGLGSSGGSTILAIISVTSIAGRLGTGALCDRFGALRMFQVCTFCMCILNACWVSCKDLASLGILAALFGLACGGSISSTTAAMAPLVGRHRAGSALGLIYGIAWLPGAMGTGLLMGLCKDYTGSYDASTYPLAAASFIAMLLAMQSERMLKEKNQEPSTTPPAAPSLSSPTAPASDPNLPSLPASPSSPVSEVEAVSVSSDHNNNPSSAVATSA